MRKFMCGAAAAAMATAGLVTSAGSAAWASTPAITRPCAFTVKWILRPDGSDQAMAEAMGYETVAHDDLSYPPPRTGC